MEAKTSSVGSYSSRIPALATGATSTSAGAPTSLFNAPGARLSVSGPALLAPPGAQGAGGSGTAASGNTTAASGAGGSAASASASSAAASSVSIYGTIQAPPPPQQLRFRTTFRNTIYDVLRNRGWKETDHATEWDFLWTERGDTYQVCSQ